MSFSLMHNEPGPVKHSHGSRGRCRLPECYCCVRARIIHRVVKIFKRDDILLEDVDADDLLAGVMNARVDGMEGTRGHGRAKRGRGE